MWQFFKKPKRKTADSSYKYHEIMSVSSVQHFDDHNPDGHVLTPRIHPSAYVAPGAIVVGDVIIGKNSSVWFNSVIRGDHSSIKIGSDTNIQELSMCHVSHTVTRV